jgi:hypothetical protein
MGARRSCSKFLVGLLTIEGLTCGCTKRFTIFVMVTAVACVVL